MNNESHTSGQSPKGEATECCTQKDLARMYGVSVFIINRWIKAIKGKLGKPTGYKYSPRQMNIFISEYGQPLYK